MSRVGLSPKPLVTDGFIVLATGVSTVTAAIAWLITPLIALGVAMAIQENGSNSLDYFAMLRGWEMCRQDAQSGKL